jgi:hypothetical protein
MDSGKRRELGRLLTELESQSQLDRLATRERGLARSRAVIRFQELKRDVILPTLREFMADLSQRGHQTRLREPSRERVRLDVQLQSRAAQRGAIEFGLHESDVGKLRVDYGWGWQRQQEVYPLERVESGFVADRVLHLLRGLV